MTAVNITPQSSAMFQADDPDAVVKLKGGPATIFVIQRGRVLATLEWPRATGGTVTIPLKTVAVSKDPLFVGVMDGLLPPALSDSLQKLMCPRCKSPNAAVPCCP